MTKGQVSPFALVKATDIVNSAGITNTTPPSMATLGATAHARAAAPVPYRQIRASYDADTITVYQAYKRSIADAAVAAQKLNASPDFKSGRMTWIKPSWSWMLYRAGYSYKDSRQERILALKMRHEDFIGLLRLAVLTHGHHGDEAADGEEPAEEVSASVANETPASTAAVGDDAGRRRRRGGKDKPADVKVQWDPERTPRLGKLSYRSIQIGVPGALSGRWVNEWIVGIEDVTERARELKRVLDEEPHVEDARLIELGLVPEEREFVVPEDVQKILGMVLEEADEAT